MAASPRGIPYDPVTPRLVEKGKLRDALGVLSNLQRETLLGACGITTDGKGKPATPMTLGEIRLKLWALWARLGLPDDQSEEPVPVTMLGAIYERRSAAGSAEAFQIWLDTGEDLAPGTQVTLDAEVLR